MQSVVGIALLVVGVVLILFGMQASASLGSRLSELFTGTPSDRTIWLLVAGVAPQPLLDSACCSQDGAERCNGTHTMSCRHWDTIGR
jgi:hypothetical protein